MNFKCIKNLLSDVNFGNFFTKGISSIIKTSKYSCEKNVNSTANSGKWGYYDAPDEDVKLSQNVKNSNIPTSFWNAVTTKSTQNTSITERARNILSNLISKFLFSLTGQVYSTTPTTPTESTEPTTPTESTEPTTPTESTEPTTPTEPTEPTTPTEPTEPTTPTESSFADIVGKISGDINTDLELYKNCSNAVLIDVRTADECASGRIPGSVNIPLDQIQSVSYDKNKILFVYCQGGGRSANAVKALTDMGYNAVSIGGIASYKGQLET